MAGNGNAYRYLGHRSLAVEADDRRLSFASKRIRRCSIKLDEVNRRLGACWVRYAISHPGADECEMRIAIPRFDDLLRVRQFRQKIDLIMPIFGTFRK